jgi:phage terminase large subunit
MGKKVVVDFSRFYDCIPRTFWDVFESKKKIRVLKGGAGSGKSYFVFSEMIYNVITNACNYLVVRQTATSNRTSTFALTKQIINRFGLQDLFKENKTDMTFECIANGAIIYYRGLDDVERLKSISFPGGSGILERVIFEEASEGNIDSFRQLLIRLRGQSKNYFQFTLMLNPVSSKNWIKKYFFDSTEYSSFSMLHHSTYKDNPFLTKDYAETLEGFKDYDQNFYNIYALGQWGVAEGRIFSNYENGKLPVSRDSLDTTDILAGLDFGYNHPTCLVLSTIIDGVLYTFDELVAYETTNDDYIDLIEEFRFIPKQQRVVYDSEDPARGNAMLKAGYSVTPAKKGKGSVQRTIDYLKSFPKWVIDAEKCPRLMQELEQYQWRKDKDGNPMDEPVKIMDDAISAVRYSIEHLAMLNAAPGVLSGKKSDQKKKLIDAKKEMRKQKREVLKAQARKKRESVSADKK